VSSAERAHANASNANSLIQGNEYGAKSNHDSESPCHLAKDFIAFLRSLPCELMCLQRDGITSQGMFECCYLCVVFGGFFWGGLGRGKGGGDGEEEEGQSVWGEGGEDARSQLTYQVVCQVQSWLERGYW